MSKEKVVLAYSGGLDTSVCVKWLQDEKNLDVVCVCGNVGQEETGLDAKKQKALDLGVLDCQVLDLRDEFSDEFLTIEETVYTFDSLIIPFRIKFWWSYKEFVNS